MDPDFFAPLDASAEDEPVRLRLVDVGWLRWRKGWSGSRSLTGTFTTATAPSIRFGDAGTFSTSRPTSTRFTQAPVARAEARNMGAKAQIIYSEVAVTRSLEFPCRKQPCLLLPHSRLED